MTDAAAPIVREPRGRRVAVLARLGRWRIRHPRLTFVALLLVLALPFIAYFGLAWGLTGFSDATKTPSASLALIAPDKPSQDRLFAEIGKATNAERDRISTLAFVIDPFSYSMPVQGARIPPDQTMAGSETLGRTRIYDSIFLALRESGCADEAGQIEVGRVRDPAALQRAEASLVTLQSGAAGLNLSRYHYHMGLLQLCKQDMQLAFNAFHAARETIGTASVPANSATGQYLFLSAAGERLTAPKLNMATLPDLPEVPGIFQEPLCQAGNYADGCALFLWPPRRSSLVKLHAFLLDPKADAAEYGGALADSRNGFTTLSVRNYANVIVAHAKAGDFENIGSLLGQLSRFTLEKDCDALGRMANIGWISGQLAEDSGNFACSPDLPTMEGAIGNDAQRLGVWREVRGYRSALRVGNFQALIARAKATDKADPDTRAFLHNVRNELLGRLGANLLARVETLSKQGAGADTKREALLELLRSEPFPWRTRMEAAIALQWGPLSASFWWPLGFTLLLGLLLRFLFWNLLAGFGLMFTQRHHLEQTGG